MTISNNIARDGGLQSAWQSGLNLNVELLKHPENTADRVYDCLIIGGGITGLTAALILQQGGQQVIIAEAHQIGFGTTGGTSAHINTFADTTYQEAESAFGTTGAQLFADAINEGFTLIKTHINTLKIDCDYQAQPGYLYAENDDEVKQLDEIYKGAVKVGVLVKYTDEVPTPVPFQKALIWDGQAQFHPLKYLQGLQKAFVEAGGLILEQTLVKGVESAEAIHTAQSTAGNIRAKAVVYATHMPPNINLFNLKCAPYRSYVMAFKLKSGNYPEALIYDSQEPYHYVRSHIINGQQLLIAGGLDHKTGHDDPEKAFAELEKYIRKYYKVSSVKYQWSSQYYIPVDGLPYIGQMPLTAKGIYCATGFNGNGMMLGTVSAKILADLILGIETKYEKVFSPSRIKPIDGFTDFVKENADVAYHFISDRFKGHATDSIKRLSPGTGKILVVDGNKIAAYKDMEGEIHALNPTCTHAACIVNWNSEEKTWDCPCHGARFDIDGKVLTGPATKDLQKINVDDYGSSD